MNVYRPDKFEGLYREQRGPELWAFLHEPESILRMEVASQLGRPAVEALSPALSSRFGARVASKPIRQMIGHMVRQVLETRGYLLDRNNVRIARLGNLFFSGSRYLDPSPA